MYAADKIIRLRWPKILKSEKCICRYVDCTQAKGLALTYWYFDGPEIYRKRDQFRNTYHVTILLEQQLYRSIASKSSW